MRVIRILLIIIATSLIVAAQEQEKPKAYKFFEFGKISDKLLKDKLEEFRKEIVEVIANEGIGIIINYGSSNEIEQRERKILDNSYKGNCGYDGEICGRRTFVNGGFRKTPMTELWIVPAGAESPIPTPDKETKLR